MIGGRNIGDKYFAKRLQKPTVDDRDVVIVNTDEETQRQRRLQIKRYFNLWDHEFSKYPAPAPSRANTGRGRIV